MKLCSLGLLFAVFSSTLPAAQPWTKSPSQWTAEDIQRILNASPWIQTASAIFGSRFRDAASDGTQELPGASAAGVAGPGTRWDGGPGRSTGGSLPSLQVILRWDSALPIREALMKSERSGSPVAERDYILAVVGLWPGSKAPVATTSQEISSSADPDDPTIHSANAIGNMRVELMRSARISRRGKKPLAPEDVKVDSGSGEILLLFPKTDPITLEDKEITFTTRFGPLEVEKRFRLKDLVYMGKLEL